VKIFQRQTQSKNGWPNPTRATKIWPGSITKIDIGALVCNMGAALDVVLFVLAKWLSYHSSLRVLHFSGQMDIQNYKINLIFCYKWKPLTAESVPGWGRWISFAYPAGTRALYLWCVNQRSKATRRCWGFTSTTLQSPARRSILGSGCLLTLVSKAIKNVFFPLSKIKF